MNKNLFELALPSLHNEFRDCKSLQEIAELYGIDDIVCGYFMVFSTDHPEYDQSVTNLEMNLGGCNFLYSLPDDGHPFTSDHFQDRLFLYDYDVSKEEIEATLRSVLEYIELVDVNRLIK